MNIQTAHSSINFYPEGEIIRGNDLIYIVGIFTIDCPVWVYKNSKLYLISKDEYDKYIGKLDEFLTDKETFNVISFSLREYLNIKEVLRYSKWINGKYPATMRTADDYQFQYCQGPQKFLVLLIKGSVVIDLLQLKHTKQFNPDAYYKYINLVRE